MDRNSIRYIVILLALSAIFCGAAVATVESAVLGKAAVPQEKTVDASAEDDESSDCEAVEDQTGFNTLEDMLLFRGPLATLWAAPQPITTSVQWLEVTPNRDGEGKLAETEQANSGESEE